MQYHVFDEAQASFASIQVVLIALTLGFGLCDWADVACFGDWGSKFDCAAG